MSNEHSQQDNTNEQSKMKQRTERLSKASLPLLEEISDEELDRATGGSSDSPNDPLFWLHHQFG